MHFSVTLQGPFEFSAVFYILSLCFLLIAGILVFFLLYLRSQNFLVSAERLRKKYRKSARSRYLELVDEIERDFKNGTIDMREVHQRLSLAVRRFVQESTGERVDCLCLSEIRKLNNKKLTSLVFQYYEPEFAFTSEADTNAAISESKELIRTWN